MLDLVEKIYEASALPELWPDALDAVSRRIGAAGGSFIAIDGAAPAWVSSPGIRNDVRAYFDEGWAQKNDRMEKLIRGGYSGFVRDVDLYQRDVVAQLPMVRDFLRPRGYGWSVALATPVPSGETLLFSIENRWRDGPISDESMRVLEALRPHISRSALLTAKLRFERARSAVEAFSIAAIPAALVRVDGHVLAANDLFAAIGGQLTIGARDRLRVAFGNSAKLIDDALSQASGPGGRRPPLSIAVPGDGERAPLVVHILPTEGAARDLFGARNALLLVTRLGASAVPETGLLRALFDLTPMEARVAQQLLAGDVGAETARRLGVGVATLKTHMKSVLRKTGFRRRVELVRFLSGLPSFQE